MNFSRIVGIWIGVLFLVGLGILLTQPKSQGTTPVATQAVPAAQAAPAMIKPVTGEVDIVSGVSALEFLRIESKGASEAPLMKQIVIELVAKGYKNVPDWARLSSLTKQKILQKGYVNQDVGKIAEEAALTSGMTR